MVAVVVSTDTDREEPTVPSVVWLVFAANGTYMNQIMCSTSTYRDIHVIESRTGYRTSWAGQDALHMQRTGSVPSGSHETVSGLLRC